MKQPNGYSPKRVYEGKVTTPLVTAELCLVTVNGAPLPQRQDISNDSYGLNWGYGGAGPTQLAVALTSDALGDEVARRWSDVVRQEIVEKLPRGKPWILTDYDVVCCVTQFSGEARAFVEEHGVFHE